MPDLEAKLVIIGAGPGGYVCAVRAAALGVDTVLIDQDEFGGTCLNRGCIPSKAIIHAANAYAMVGDQKMLGIETSAALLDFKVTQKWKNGIIEKLRGGIGGLVKKTGVKFLKGRAEVLDGKTVKVHGADGETVIACNALVLATGSVPLELKSLPFDEDVLSSTDILELKKLPKSLAVVGGGYIGIELGTAMAKLGVKVSILEAGERILAQYDKKLTAPIEAKLKALGVEVHTKAFAKEMKKGELAYEKEGSLVKLKSEKALVTIGRKALTAQAGIDGLFLKTENQLIAIDKRCETSMRNVFAIGDITPGPQLAHRAMAQGKLVAEVIAGQNKAWDKQAVPAICFSDPEIVSVGVSAINADKASMKISEFPLAANGRSLSLGAGAGFIRVISDKQSHVVLGLEAVGAEVAELSAQFTLAIEMGACLEDIGDTIHAHPTIGEATQEAALMALGEAIHF